MKKHKVFMACMLSLAIFTAYVIMDSFFISSSLMKLFFKTQRGFMAQKTALASHMMILIFLAAAEVVYSSYLLPALLRTV